MLIMKRIHILHFFLIMAVGVALAGCGRDEEANPDVTIDIGPADNTVFPRTNGLLPGLFDIGNGKYVRFSHGNLQYKASTNQWRLAANQYDRVGLGNRNISASGSQWIDLFAWGTSGCDPDVPVCYCSIDDSTVIPVKESLLSPTNLYDWGLYNAIPNAGDSAGWLRTLSGSQWDYLLNQRYLAKEKRGVAKVEGVVGCVLLPDLWLPPQGLPFVPDTSQYMSADSVQVNTSYVNVYDRNTWQAMEGEGAVFLPYAGHRKGRNVIGVDERGQYWSSTSRSLLSGTFNYMDLNKKTTEFCNWYIGMAVRLVHFEN